MSRTLKLSVTFLIASMLGIAVQANAQQPQPERRASTITFYENEGYSGRWFSTDRQIRNFRRFGFNDAADSVKVRGGRWEVCTGPRFEGRCVVLRRGDYPSLRQAGLEDRISSARPLARGNRYYNQEGAYDREAPDRR
jgi:hypothetical protein